MYKHYIFDLYGTLIDLHTDEEKPTLWLELAKFFSYNGAIYSGEELKQQYLHHVQLALSRIKHTEHPDIDITKVFRTLYQNKSVKPGASLITQTTRLFRVLSLDYIRLYEGVLETLHRLKQSGCKLYILSNGQRDFSLPELQLLGIHDLFDGMYFSADHQICKPDPAFMQVLLSAHGIEIKDAVMIGNDHTTDIEVARRVGMDAVYIHTNCSREIQHVDCKFQIWDNRFSRLVDHFRLSGPSLA